MVYCHAYGCANRPEKDKGKRHYFSFPNPIREKDRLTQWLHNSRVGHTIETFSNNKNKRICSDHFHPDCFEDNKVARMLNYIPKYVKLKCGAIPTVFKHKIYEMINMNGDARSTEEMECWDIDGSIECLLACESSWVCEDKMSISAAEMLPSYWSSQSNINEIIKIEITEDAEECNSDVPVEKWPSKSKIEDNASKKVKVESYCDKLPDIGRNFSSSLNPDLLSNSISNEYFTSKKYQCVKCKLNFDSYNSLTLHISSPLPCDDTVTHTEASKAHTKKSLSTATTKNYKCKVCNCSFSQMKELDSHMIIHSLEQRFNVSNKKDSDTTMRSIEQRFNKKDSDTTMRSIEQRFNKKDPDKTMHEGSHLEMLQAISDETYMCHICGQVFSDDSNLQIHILLHSNALELFSCSVCNQSFSDETLYMKHKLTHTEQRTSMSTSIQASGNGWTHKSEKPFKCLTCGREFAHRYYLTNHERTHKGGKPFVCEMCDKRFSSKPELEKHSLLHEKPFVCDLCYERFSLNSELQQHTLTEHSVKKPFVCEICNKGFFRRDTLKIHKITHENDLINQCITNGPSSNGENSSIINCDQDLLQCSTCSKEFSSFATLHAHERNHTRPRMKVYKCTICPKSFVKRSDLKRHLMTHTGERPFQCEICNKAFTRNSHLKTHRMLHTGEKPFKCLLCDKGFTKQSDFKRHFNSHNDGKDASPEVIVL